MVSAEGLVFRPKALPPGLDFPEIVLHVAGILQGGRPVYLFRAKIKGIHILSYFWILLIPS